MKFVMSFSGGKDSIMALHKMVEAGHEAVGLLVMCREEEKRSWVHGMDMAMMEAFSEALGIPLLCCYTDGENYGAEMERCLSQAGEEMGAEACVFGDIDIEDHWKWNEERCRAAGIRAVLPLWGCSREENVYDVISAGYRCIVKCIRNGVLPESMLGQELSAELLEQMKQYDIDLCGENGEYHTIVVDGPVFKHPLKLKNRGNIRFEYVAVADLVV